MPKTAKVTSIITGMHRSGTTWLGSLLAAFPALAVVHEPFNLDFGLRDIPRWYLDHRDPRDIDFFARSREALENGAPCYRRGWFWRKPGRSFLRAVAGGAAERSYRTAFSSGKPNLVLKDPFLLMMVPHLAAAGIRCIVMIRHPAAILVSLRRMGWHVPIEHLRSRPSLDPVVLQRNMSEAESMGVFWAGVYQPVWSLVEAKSTENLLLLCHEEMFHNVDDTVERLADFLQFEDGLDAAREFARKTTTGTVIMPGKGKIHELSRDSKKLVKAWKSRVSDSELKEIVSRAGPLYRYFYHGGP